MRKKRIEIIIDAKKCTAFQKETILEVASRNGIEIPSLCYHPDLTAKAHCRLCLVEIEGRSGFFPACTTQVEKGMKVITDSPGLRRARQVNLELIFSQHQEECFDCVWNFNCQMLNLAKKYNVEITHFQDRKKGYPVFQFGPALIFDSSKCVDCRACIEVCKNQGVGVLGIKKNQSFWEVMPLENFEEKCCYCGQCIIHCPVGAFEAVGEFEKVEKPLLDKSKTIVFQFAPAVRVSIGEEFNFSPGTILTEKLVAGIRKLGGGVVFDTSVGADFTTFEEAKELIERLKERKNLPLFTSCCPAWVRFVEIYYPEFIPNLTTVRSPHMILGGLVKSFWARRQKIEAEKIVVVSIMPCVAKKYEIKREDLKVNNLFPVDYVLTTRELAFLFKKYKIDLRKIAPSQADIPLGIPSGAGVIYGASGGVMEAALRTFSYLTTRKNFNKIKFQNLGKNEEIKTAKIKIGAYSLRAATVNGLGNAVKILQELKKKPDLYDYIEVMACPGGCIGGGGQPLPVSPQIRKERAESLYQIYKTKEIRFAHENPVLKEVYDALSPQEIISITHRKE